MNSFLLIGLGRFGRHIAIKLAELNQEIMAVDKDENKVNSVLPYVTDAQIGDSTNEDFLYSLGVPNFDVCIVAIGDDFQSSLETASLLKELGAKMVVARATRDVHEKFLLRNGADRVVYPEKQLGIWTAVTYSSERIFDYIDLGNNHAILEVSVPDEWAGKNVIEIDVRRRFGINILALKKNGELKAALGPDTVFSAGDRVLALGTVKDIEKCFKI